MSSHADAIRAGLSAGRAAALERHERREDPFSVVAGLSADVDGLLGGLFEDIVGDERDRVALLAAGGYGRRELCPRSDVDLLFLREKTCRAERIERMVRALWDGGVQLGHAVRTPEECLVFMKDDLSTANAVLESRFLAGSESLHRRFLDRAEGRYRRAHGASFVAQKLELLRRSIEDPDRTIYVVEPNLKEGACALRDIQRVLWIENMKRGGGVSFATLFREELLPRDDLDRLREAYAFYLRVRCDLHFLNGVRQDVLERDAVPVVARRLGYAAGREDRAAAEALMGDYFRHARLVYRFLRYYLEVGARPEGILERARRRYRAVTVLPGVARYRDRIYLSAGTPPPADGAPAGAERILELFVEAQETGARLSETLCDWVRKEAGRIDPAGFLAPEVMRAFRRILQRGRDIGRILKSLHETEVLGRIIPEFSGLTCLVSYDGHHQFTVDEHTLRTLAELDRIEVDDRYPEKEFRRVLTEIKDPLPLRLALLLHDAGKAAPGDHAVIGTEAATLICERLGLDARTTEVVNFLVYRHLELFSFSALRDFREEGVIESLARLVESEERLKMLYLLTYIDIVSVGPGTWTHWKGAQLAELYERTRIHLQTGGPVGDGLAAALESSRLDDSERRRVVDHCGKMAGGGYARENLPERMLEHVRLVETFVETREMQVSAARRVGYDEITFCVADRPRLFADLTGLLFSEGFNVLGARIYSRSDGVVIDVFQVEIADTVSLGLEERADRIRKKLRRIESRQQVVEDFIRQRTLSYRSQKWRRPLYGPSVSFDNDSSAACTVIEVSAGDRPGLLYDLAHALHRLGLDLRTAKVSTLLDRARDAFYVVERDGRKVDNAARRAEIADALKASVQSATHLHAR